MPEWRKYCGKYNLRFSGYKLKWWARLALAMDLDKYTPRITVYEKDGFLCLMESRFMENMGTQHHVDRRLEEYKPSLFFTASGESLNFTGQTPSWRNYRLKKR